MQLKKYREDFFKGSSQLKKNMMNSVAQNEQQSEWTTFAILVFCDHMWQMVTEETEKSII